MSEKRFVVRFLGKTEKRLEKVPSRIQIKFRHLVMDLSLTGPMQPRWPNFSKLGKDEYHCHLSRSWVACWKHDKNTVIIEVTYVGSRQNPPY